MKSKKMNLGDLVFVLFYMYKGEIKGSTRIQKLIDIIRLDSQLDIDVDYSPYNYGDFSQNVQDVIQVYIDNSWLSKKELTVTNGNRLDVYNLTSSGNRIAKTLYEGLLTSELEELKLVDKFIDTNQRDLISFSYFWYPETATKSIIRRDIFKRRKITQILNGDLENEYNSIISSGISIKDEIRKSWKC